MNIKPSKLIVGIISVILLIVIFAACSANEQDITLGKNGETVIADMYGPYVVISKTDFRDPYDRVVDKYLVYDKTTFICYELSVGLYRYDIEPYYTINDNDQIFMNKYDFGDLIEIHLYQGNF